MMESPYIPLKFKNPNPSSEKQEAIQPVVDFLEDLREGNAHSMHKHILPFGLGVNIRPTGIIQATLIGLVDRVSKLITDQIVAEPLYDVEVWVDGNIAVAWAPYDFFVTRDRETKMSHRGTNIFFLAKELEG